MNRRSETTTKVFVGNLPANATVKDLRELFTPYGAIAECDIAIRCGFLHLEDKDLAMKAIEELNNTTFMGVRISVEKGRVKPPSRNRGGGRGGLGGGPMRGGKDRGGPYARDGFGRPPRAGNFGGRDFEPYGDRYGYDRGDRFDGYGDRRPPFEDRRGGDNFGRPYPNGYDRRAPYDDRQYSAGGYPVDGRMPMDRAEGYEDRRQTVGGDRRLLMDQQVGQSRPPAGPYGGDGNDMYSRRGAATKPVDRIGSYQGTATDYENQQSTGYSGQSAGYGGGYGDTRGTSSSYDSRSAVQPGAYGDGRAPIMQGGYENRSATPQTGATMYPDTRSASGGAMASYGENAPANYNNALNSGYDPYMAGRNGNYDAAYPPLPQQRGFVSGGGPAPRRDAPQGPGRRF